MRNSWTFLVVGTERGTGPYEFLVGPLSLFTKEVRKSQGCLLVVDGQRGALKKLQD